MASDLTLTKHVEETINKAKKVLGLLKCTISSKNRDIFQFLYKSLVRQILEYASLVWSPRLAKDNHEIEKVKRRALWIILGQRRQEMVHDDRCKILTGKWNSLEGRREFLTLVECYNYKIVFSLNGLNFSDYFELCGSNKPRSIHQYRIQTKLTKLNLYKYFFFVKIIKFWNYLPSNVINCHDSTNINKFKLRLKNHMNFIEWTFYTVFLWFLHIFMNLLLYNVCFLLLYILGDP